MLTHMGGSNPLVAVFRAAVNDEPNNVYARFNLANLLAAEDRHEEALGHLDRVNALVPGYEGGAAWLRRGNSLVALGRYAEAVAAYDRVLKIPYTGRCSHASASARKAAALDRLGRRQEAKAARAQAQDLENREGIEWIKEGNIYSSAGEHLDAIASYDKAIALNWKGRPVALLNRGLAKKALGKLDEAIADIEAALVQAADLAPAEMSRALIRFEQSEKDGPAQVLSVLGKLVATMTDAFAHYNRASVRARLGNLPGAAEDLRAALALAPELSKEASTEAGFKTLRQDPAYSDLWRGEGEQAP
jgi:tetratricopeptide (TPR) repeat protein